MTSLQDIILHQLQCKGCFNYMEPPIRLCAKGHSACDSCAQKFTTCIICQYPFMTTRNISLEEISYEIDFKCKNCDYVSNSTLMAQHQKYCDGKNLIYRCTKEITQENYLKKICTWSGCVEEIFDHFKNFHETSLYEVPLGKKDKFQWKLPYRQNQRDINVILCNEDKFLQVIHYNYTSQNLHFAVINIGKTKDKFYFEIQINSGPDKLKFKRKVEEEYIKITEILQNEHYIKVPLEKFANFKIKERIIFWNLVIYKDCE